MKLSEKLIQANETIRLLSRLLIETKEELNQLKHNLPPKKGKQLFLNAENKKTKTH